MLILSPTLPFEQHLLQSRWNKQNRRWDEINALGNKHLVGTIQYVSYQGWWIIWQDKRGEMSDLIFLGRTVEEAQQRVNSA